MNGKEILIRNVNNAMPVAEKMNPIEKENRPKMIYEKYKELIDKIKEAGEIDELRTVEEFIRYFKEYVNFIYSTGLKMPIVELKFSPDVVDQSVTTLEELKKKRLQSVIDACDYLNMSCKVYGIEPFCPKLSAGKEEFAEFAVKFVAEIYKAALQERLNIQNI